MNKEVFIKSLEELGITLSDEQLNKLERFYQLLIEWNEKINLTTITEKEEVYLKHFFDSLTLIKAINLHENLSVLDVGTGAGLPGIVLKIVFPSLQIMLLDSLNKRINYLNAIIKELDLNGITTICIRSEDYAAYVREEYDLVIARAVSNLPTLIEICLPLVKINGVFIAMKANLDDELERSENILKAMHGKISSVTEFELPIELSKRSLVKITKIEKTNIKYPRRYSEIKKINEIKIDNEVK